MNESAQGNEEAEYIYQPLEAGAREIRVLRLHPGHYNDNISGALSTISLGSNESYDALSYQWGDPTTTSVVYFGQKELPVTTSLHDALRFIRKPDEETTIWIDAISINQKDVSERNKQVSIMRDIYSNASTVRVWLNQEIDSSNPCFEALTRFCKTSSTEDLGDQASLWQPIADLFQDPYWDRLWIQQELLSANNIILHCRKDTLSGQSIGLLQWLILRRQKEHPQGLIHGDEGGWSDMSSRMKLALTPSRHLLWWRAMISRKEPIDWVTLLPPDMESKNWEEMLSQGPAVLHMPTYLLGALRIAQRLSVTDPKDRFYGILSLVADVEPGDLRIDYRKTIPEVYADTCVLIARKYRYLAFLPHANNPKDGTTDLAGRPSWVPNWNDFVDPGFFWAPFNATGSLRCLADPFSSPHSSPSLRAQGFCIDFLRPAFKLSGTDIPSIDLLALLTLLIALPVSTQDSDDQSSDDVTDAILVLPSGYDLGVAIRTRVTILGTTLTGPSMGMAHISATVATEETFFYTLILLRAAAVHAALSDPLGLDDLVSLRAASDDVLTQWLGNILELSDLRLDKSIIAVVDLRDMLSKGFEFIPEKFRTFLRFVYLTMVDLSLTTTVGKRVVVTQQIPLGEDDEVWLLFGCPTPMLLRREQGEYTVVGPVYVEGFMYGEAVVGLEGVLVDGQRIGEWEVKTFELR